MFNKLKDVISSRFIDANFLENRKQYIMQIGLIFVCVSVIMVLCRFFDGVIALSLGASSFILFVSPHANGARSKYLIGGYICGLVSGALFNFVYYIIASLSFAGREFVLIAVCAAAASLAAFLMVVTNHEHPPAAALALGLSAEPELLKAAAAAIIGVTILCVVRRLLKKRLKNLI